MDTSFSLSTHRREWIFNDGQTLDEQRTRANDAAAGHIMNAIERFSARQNGVTASGATLRPLPLGLNASVASSPNGNNDITSPSTSLATPSATPLTLSLLPSSSMMSTSARATVPLSPGNPVGDSPIPFSLAGAMSAAASPAFAATPPSSSANAPLPQSATHAAAMGVAALRMSMSPLSSSLAGTAIGDHHHHAITLTPDTEGPRPMPFAPSPGVTSMALSPIPERKSGVFLTPQKPAKPLEPLTLTEETALRTFYEVEIGNVARSYRFPAEVPATAIVFFKRFFLRKSVMDFSPKDIMVCCIYLASKAEEAFIKLGPLCNHTRTREETVKNLEVALLEGIKFHLRVYHPYRPLRGLLQAIKEPLAEGGPVPDISDAQFAALETRARALIETSFLTDCSLLHPPAQVAFAALLQAGGELKCTAVEQWVQSWCAQQRTGPELDALLARFMTIGTTLLAGQAVAANIDRTEQRRLEDKLNPLVTIANTERAEAEERRNRQIERKRHARERLRNQEREARSALLLGSNTLRPAANTNTNSGSGDQGEFTLSKKRLKMTPRAPALPNMLAT